MARIQFVVVNHQGQWKISLDGIHYGPYDTQAGAIRAAVDAAQDTGKKGLNAQVVVQGVDSTFRTEWTYGRDPYPPKG